MRAPSAWTCRRKEKAIERAKADQNENTRFEVADAEAFQPTEKYDVIVFNEVMSFLTDPREVLLRYATHLRPGGIVIVSMFRIANSLRMWKLLEGVAPILDAVSVTNIAKRLTWDIKVYGGPDG